jgi:hypothetical protein
MGDCDSIRCFQKLNTIIDSLPGQRRHQSSKVDHLLLAAAILQKGFIEGYIIPRCPFFIHFAPEDTAENLEQEAPARLQRSGFGW